MARKKKETGQVLIERVVEPCEMPKLVDVKGTKIYAYRNVNNKIRVSATKNSNEVDILLTDIKDVTDSMLKFIEQPTMVVHKFARFVRSRKDRLKNAVIGVELSPFDWRLHKNIDITKTFAYCGVQLGPVSITIMW
jgi:hypothetical protein